MPNVLIQISVSSLDSRRILL